MFFLHLSCKKENFFPFTTWLLLSSFGTLLTSSLGVYALLVARINVKNVMITNAFGLESNFDQLNIITSAKKKFVTFHTNYVLPFTTLQNVLLLNIFLIIAIVICQQLHNFQTQCFANKRAPPLA
ncbi:hypothetical protein [Bartonella heixiaziensis]|uniref:hypothetical protein n=1 Tax=Bartonella heixiaziensis TaxID=1461000 RepID=UPI003D1C381C